jgi:hypothetical protein
MFCFVVNVNTKCKNCTYLGGVKRTAKRVVFQLFDFINEKQISEVFINDNNVLRFRNIILPPCSWSKRVG